MSEPVPSSATLRLRPEELVWREVEGEVVVLDLRANTYLSVNSSGLTIWRRLEEGASLNDLIDALVREHRVDEKRARKDARVFVSMLAERKLLAAGESR